MHPRTPHRWLGLTVAAACLAGAPGHSRAQCTRSADVELFASDGVAWDLYARDVALSDDWMAAGSPAANGGAGAVYVYDRGPTPTEAKVLPVAATPDQFGWSVGLWDDWLAVGDPGWSTGRGRVDLYRYNAGTDSWKFTKALQGVAGGDQFGYSLWIADGRLVVGSPDAQSSGRVRLYEIVAGTWQFVITLTPNAGDAGQRFGAAVSYAKERIVVGSPHPGDVGLFEAYQWNDGGVVWQAEVVDPDAGATQQFGASVHTDGSRAIVGKPMDPGGGAGTGSAYLYVTKGGLWGLEKKLSPPGGSFGSQFGTDVAICGDVAFVGAPGFTHLGVLTGTVRQYRNVGTGQWVLQTDLRGYGVNGLFGQSVAVDPAEVIAGSPYDFGMAASSGSAYRFAMRDLDLNMSPENVPLFGAVQADLCGGVPGNLLGLFVTGVDGMPFFVPIQFGFFPANGRWSLNGAHINPAYSGLNLDLMGLAINLDSKVVSSNVASVELL